jgi:hypothetical protein
MQARVEKLKAAQLARKAGTGSGAASGNNFDTMTSSTVKFVEVGAATCADVSYPLPSSLAAAQHETAVAIPADLSHPDMLEVEEADDGRPERGDTAANDTTLPPILS